MDTWSYGGRKSPKNTNTSKVSLGISNQSSITVTSPWLSSGCPNHWSTWNEDEIVKMLILIDFVQQVQRWFVERNVNDETNKMSESPNDVIIFRLSMESSHHSIHRFSIDILSSERPTLQDCWIEIRNWTRKALQEKRAEIDTGLKSEFRSEILSKPWTEFRIPVQFAFYISRFPQKTKAGKADFQKLRIFQDWMIREEIFELNESEKCREEHWNKQKERRLPCKSFICVNHSVCFRESRHRALVLFVQCQRICNRITSETAIASW
jgi:hypothetical protein